MKFRSVLIGAALVVGTAAITAQVVSQDTAKHQPPMSAEEQMMMEKWMAYATPGAQHKVLEQKAGDWNLVVKWWMDPAAPPSESTGTSKMEMIMDGRYLVDETHGQTDHGPFHGMGCTAYDNLKQKYVGAWIDSMSTGIMVHEGSYDASTKTFTYTGESPDVMTGKMKKVKTTEKMISADKWVMEMFDKDKDGKEYKSMEITYTRAN